MGLFGSSSPESRMMAGVGIAGVVGVAFVLLALAGANALYGGSGPAVFVGLLALAALGGWWAVTGYKRAESGGVR